MTDQDKEDLIKRTIHWQQNGLDLDKRNCLILNFGADLMMNYPQIRKFIFYLYITSLNYTCHNVDIIWVSGCLLDLLELFKSDPVNRSHEETLSIVNMMFLLYTD